MGSTVVDDAITQIQNDPINSFSETGKTILKLAEDIIIKKEGRISCFKDLNNKLFLFFYE